MTGGQDWLDDIEVRLLSPMVTYKENATEDAPALLAALRAVLAYADRCDVVGRAGHEDDDLKATHRQVAEELRDLIATALDVTP